MLELGRLLAHDGLWGGRQLIPRHVVFERRYAENRLERLPGFAADLVRLKVDVIAAHGTLAPLSAKQASSTIPIVMTTAGDPLGSGLVANLARPGGQRHRNEPHGTGVGREAARIAQRGSSQACTRGGPLECSQSVYAARRTGSRSSRSGLPDSFGRWRAAPSRRCTCAFSYRRSGRCGRSEDRPCGAWNICGPSARP